MSHKFTRSLVFALSTLLLAACTTLTPEPPTPSPLPAAMPDSAAGVAPAWRAQLGGVVNWAPALLTTPNGNQLLVVSSDADEVVALDPASGAEVWRFTPAGRLWTDSVAVLGDAVFAASEGALVTLLDGATGQPRWQRSLQPAEGDPLPGLEARSRPILADGVIYVPTAGVGSRAAVVNAHLAAPLVALDMATGAELWRFVSDGYMLRAPAVDTAGDVVYVGGNALPKTDVDEGGVLRIYALNRSDGSLRWTHESEDGLIKSLWAGAGAVAYVAYRDFVVGLDGASGAETYRHNTGNWVQSFTVFPERPAPSGLPLLVYGSANGFLNAIDPATGKFVWRYNIEGTFNYPMGNAVLAGDRVTFISQQGDLYAVHAADGSLVWRHATGIESRDGIAVGDGRIYVGSVDGTIYAFELR